MVYRHTANVQRLTCEFCGWSAKVQRSLDNHIFQHHDNSKFQCIICQRNFKSADGLMRHEKSHSKNRIIIHECTLCNRVFKSKHALFLHNERFHNDDVDQNLQCEFCPSKKFQSRVVLKSHMHLHKSRCRYESCDFTFRSEAQMEIHYALVHLKDNNNKVCCVTKFISISFIE